jgi:SDR family mycofactocin-dependent oxidoreductase
MGLLEGQVALISGAARGQGRSHAVRLAEEGADIIALDICADIASNPYPLATIADLDETVSMVEAKDRRIVASVTDVRDAGAVRSAVERGVEQFGHVDIVCANAGITAYVRPWEMTDAVWRDVIDTNLTGVWNLVRAALTHMIPAGRGGSIAITSSSAAHIGLANLCAYSAAKAGLVGLMQNLAVELAPYLIRVNTIHPTGVNTAMVHNQATYDIFLPGANLAQDRVPGDQAGAIAAAMAGLNALPIPWVEPVDISNAIVYLASHFGRYVTGTQFRVDAGSATR